MADEITGSVPANPPAAPPQTTQTPPPADGGAEVRLTSAQLKQRLDETRASAEKRVLEALGVDSLDKAKELASQPKGGKVRKRLKELEEKNSSQEATIAALKTQVGAIAGERAGRALADLPEHARKEIEATTNDPEERAALADLARKLIAQSPSAAPVAVPSAQTPAAPATSPPPPPATTMSTAPAPGGAGGSPANHRQEWERLKQDNPVAASHYLKLHQKQIFPAP